MLWKLKAAIKVAIQRFRYPVLRLQSHDWSQEDHAHICVAARLLNEQDFLEVCPIAKDKNAVLELEDVCDFCPHLVILDFNTDENGKKSIHMAF